jgi:uncharacterized protein YqjF (DUF2071 family)
MESNHRRFPPWLANVTRATRELDRNGVYVVCLFADGTRLYIDIKSTSSEMNPSLTNGMIKRFRVFDSERDNTVYERFIEQINEWRLHAATSPEHPNILGHYVQSHRA